MIPRGLIARRAVSVLVDAQEHGRGNVHWDQHRACSDEWVDDLEESHWTGAENNLEQTSAEVQEEGDGEGNNFGSKLFTRQPRAFGDVILKLTCLFLRARFSLVNLSLSLSLKALYNLEAAMI